MTSFGRNIQTVSIISVITMLLLLTSCHSDIKIKDAFVFVHDEWSFEITPELGSAEWYKANQALNSEWSLFLENDKIMIAKSVYSSEFRFDVSDGYFIGKNKGEFGGSLKFRKGIIAYTLDNYCNPIAMFFLGDELFLLEGISHLMLYNGKVYKIENNSNKWQMGESYTLRGSPHAVTVDNDRAYIVTDTTISVIYKSQNGLSIDILAELNFMEGLYPTSIVKKDNTLYIGMRGGILTFDLESKETFWLVKK